MQASERDSEAVQYYAIMITSIVAHDYNNKIRLKSAMAHKEWVMISNMDRHHLTSHPRALSSAVFVLYDHRAACS